MNHQLRSEVLPLTDRGFQHIEYRSVFHSEHSSLRGVDPWLDSRPQGTLAHSSFCKAWIKDCGGDDGPLRCTMGMQTRPSGRVKIQLRRDVQECTWDCMANPVVRLGEEKMWRAILEKSWLKHPRSNGIYIFTSEEHVPFLVEKQAEGMDHGSEGAFEKELERWPCILYPKRHAKTTNLCTEMYRNVQKYVQEAYPQTYPRFCKLTSSK